MKLKKVYAVIGIIVVSLLIFHGVWYVNQKAYEPYCEGYDLYFTAYGKTTDQAQYTVSLPKYPQFTGNVAIGNLEDTLAIIMWPGLFAKEIKEYGVTLVDQGIGYEVYVDEKMNYLETKKNQFLADERETVEQLLEQHHAELVNMRELAKGEWGL